jgi:hypothetical protein
MHKGVPSLSMEILSGMEEGLPRFEFKSIKGTISHCFKR